MVEAKKEEEKGTADTRQQLSFTTLPGTRESIHRSPSPTPPLLLSK